MGVKSTAKRLGVTVEQLRDYRRSGMKHCWSCKRWLPAARFSLHAGRSDGRDSECGVCKSKRMAEAREAQREHVCCPNCGHDIKE